MTDDARRRRRRQARSTAAPVPAEAAPVPAEASPPREPHPEPPPARRRAPHDPAERGLRDLVGSGRSMLGVEGALRGRDVNRPTDDDLAEAERDIVIVHRRWTPDSRH